MLLHVLSDLHLERSTMQAARPPCDVVILAGDVAGSTDGMRWAREQWPERPVLYVAGNHEFYGQQLPGLLGELRSAAEGSSVRLLENELAVLHGVRFLGCTLWSDFDFDGPEQRERSMSICGRVVNDYAQIGFGTEGRRLIPADTRDVHLQSRRWLAQRLSEPHEGPTVVITHHAPIIRTRPESSLLRAVAGAFASDLEDLMGAGKADLWIFGHTHRWADLEVRGTRVISNPRGYPDQPVDGFEPALVVEVTR